MKKQVFTQLKSTPNYQKRTFTIRYYENGRLIRKRRTMLMSPDEFHDALQMTSNDWYHYLNNDNSYVLSYH